MDAKPKQNSSIKNAVPANGTAASDNFERWASAVRQQMLDCLQKSRRGSKTRRKTQR